MTNGSLLDRAMARAKPLADVVLREGQVLFPYRASALKNRYRWQWGVLAPPAWVEATGSDRSATTVECIADVRAGASVSVRVRFLHLEARSAEEAAAAEIWDEGVEQHVDVGPLHVPPSVTSTSAATAPVCAAPALTTEHARVNGSAGPCVVVRERRRVDGAVTLELHRIAGPWPLVRVRVAVENSTAWHRSGADRADALRSSLIAVHAVLAVERGAFVSSIDPPEFASGAVATCHSSGLWPSLVGPVTDGDVMLAAPIILPDHAAVAAPSPGDTCDATEIDELLALSVSALGEQERREARMTDPVAAAIIERLGAASARPTAALHASAPAPDPRAEIGGETLRRESRVRLRPAAGGDAQDAFIAGRIGIVEKVLHDADGGTHVAVTIEGDPGADLHRLQGRYRYFRLHELEPPDQR